METSDDGRKALTDLLRRKAGLKSSYTSLLISGVKSPSLDLALRIEEATGIPPSFWATADRGNRPAMWARIQGEK